MVPQQYCLRWKHHHSNVQSMFAHLLEKERFCDVTLYCSPSFSTQVPNKDLIDPQTIKGVSLRAHRVVLAACSELLGTLLGAHESLGEPVLVIDGAEPCHLKALLDYMYTGEMNVHHSQLASLLKTAEELRIKGLTDIRWNNKDEPPDSQQGLETTVTQDKKPESPRKLSPVQKRDSKCQPKLSDTIVMEDVCVKEEDSEAERDRYSVNGGPPPLIKLCTKDRIQIKRESSEPDSPSPKRQRAISMNDHADDESRGSLTKSEKDNEWQHGNLDITAERVIGWPEPEPEADNWSGDVSDDEWADAPTDIGSFLHTNLRVDGDNSAAEDDSVESSPAAPAASSSSSSTVHIDMTPSVKREPSSVVCKGLSDPRFADVVKLNDYLQHGRRPQFWEENYVKRVMEAVRVKELEMKQAAEILGVSYGTLYGRYRDVYGCINRPYRTARDFWQAKGPSEVLERLQRGELSLDAACLALGVSHNNLSSFLADTDKELFEPIPIEMDPSLRKRASTFLATSALVKSAAKLQKKPTFVKDVKSVTVGSVTDDDSIPASVITTHDKGIIQDSTTTTSGGSWPSIRIANIESLRSSPPTPSTSPSTPSTPTPTSPSHIMRSRPDLTIIAAKKPEAENGT